MRALPSTDIAQPTGTLGGSSMTTIAEQVGRVVGGRYRLLAPVGVGASSQVFAASDTRLARRVAVKVLHPMLAADRAFLRRFRAEARLAASLDHPHVMRVFDWGEEDEGPYLVLEYLGGGSLRSLLDSGARLSHSQVVSIGAQAASGLAYAHRRGIVHRDIKPSNLLFDEEGHLRIADFGVARALAESALTEPLGAVFGTARYASPAQAEGRVLDDRTDVYSLALVLYETLTGRVPFVRDTITATLMSRVGASLPISPELGPLAPILAQAAISEPLARLDAAAIQSDLEFLGRELPPPEPLPLARVRFASGATLRLDRDPTIQDVSTQRTPAVEAAPGPTTPADYPATVVLPSPAPAEFEGGVANGEHLEDGAGPSDRRRGRRERQQRERQPRQPRQPRQQRPHRGRRIALWLSAAVLLLGALAAGAFAYVKLDVYGHVVPRLTSISLPKAENLAKAVGLKATETGSSWDAKVLPGWVISQSIRPGRHERAGVTIGLVVSKGVEPVKVPNLTGDGLKAATAALSSAHLKATPIPQYNPTVPVGRVINWTSKGQSVKPGTSITVYISKGPAPRDVPQVASTDTYSEAAALLARKGFRPYKATEHTMLAPAGWVVFVSPDHSSGPQKYDSPVEVMISLGPPSIEIPFVGSDSLGQYRALLQHDGFVVKAYGPPGPVIYTVPSPGSYHLEGSTVYVYTI
jgi:serine/threonine-protein kinase